MKLVYIANARIPTEKAHGIQIMKMCEAFSDLGNNVELWVPSRKTKIKDDAFDFYGVHPNFKIKRLWCLDTVHLGKIGYRIEMITFLFSCFIKAFLKREIFYTREESVAALFSLFRKKVFWEDHRGHINLFVRAILAMKVPIVSISKGLKDFYLDLGVSSDLVLIASDAVDLQQFQISKTKEESRESLGLPLDKKIIMYIGLFEDWKGYKTVLETSKIISDESIQFVMIGEGGDMEEIRAAYPKVIFTGYKPYRDLPTNQIAADILLIPNSAKEKISSHFTSPIKLFAHMASGRPIIASDLPSLREVLNDTNAVFFTPDEPKSLASSIMEVLNKPEDAKLVADRALEKVKEYSWSKRAENIVRYVSMFKKNKPDVAGDESSPLLNKRQFEKVLLVTSTLDAASGGWGKYSFDLVTALKRRGVDVTVHIIEHPLRFKRNFFLGWLEAFKMHRKYKDYEFDVIHNAVEPYAFLVSIFAKLMKTKYVITAHGTYSILFLAHPIYRWFQRFAYKNASRIIAVSSYTSRRLAHYVQYDNVAVIPNGFNYVEKRITKKQKDHAVLLSVGGIKERKGYDKVIEALARVKNDLGAFTYYIVGAKHDISYADRLLNLAKEKGLNDHIVFTGPVSPEQKENFYEEADIFILTPISEGLHFEGFGLVYLEASAAGTPVIGSLESGAEDAIKDGETGILVPQSDPDTLAKSILEILKNKDVAQRMSANGVKWSRDHDWDNIIREYIKVYRQA